MTTNNHPAHGPVSLDRLHQISEILSKAAAHSDGGNLGYAMADAVKVIDEVLGRRQADNPPVHPTIADEKLDDETLQELIEFRRSTFEYHSKEGHKVQTIIHGVVLSALLELQDRRAAMLQAEPVSQRYKLPPNSFTDEELEGMIHGNNPQSNAYRELLAFRRNSPVIPESWVACSERRPPEGYEPDGGAVCYLVWHKNEVDCGPQYSISNVFFLRKHWEKNFSHWMPLPAAPKQE